ncbi:MAG: substrate-binding domain-containing protein [Bacilli bacterium]|nr:substrate-binding domain-containing protein [Bacilli bacterium]
MKKNTLKIITIVSASFIATSCSLFQTKYFDWLKSTNNNTEINYCLLIGQNEHSDSIERTRYTREALHTRDAASEINGNANLGTPKIGQLTLGGKSSTDPLNPAPEREFKVTELEHMEQKSLAGVVWDSITANGTTSTWISKHNEKITMIISNNDGMAEGALFASNYIKDLPLFGYDANTSTLKLITQGKIMGTVDQNASAQTSAAYLMIRNILEDIDNKANGIGTTAYNPLNRGFNGEESATADGIYIEGFNSDTQITELEKEGITNPFHDDRSPNNMDLSKTDGYHQILSKSIAIDDTNIDTFVDESGEVRKPHDLAWSDIGYVHKKGSKKPNKTYNICHVYNNAAEVYLQGTMHDYYVEYDDELGLAIQKIDGDGVDEQKIFSQLEGACAGTQFDAFLINMVTTTDGGTFVDNISKYAASKEGKGNPPKGGWDKWEDRLDTPLIFWNKQPQTVDGKVDVDTMNNKYFKYTYFVGVDASYGGQEQGNMIVRYLERQYENSIKNK